MIPFSGKERDGRKLGLAKNRTEKILPETAGKKTKKLTDLWPKANQNGKFSNTAPLTISKNL